MTLPTVTLEEIRLAVMKKYYAGHQPHVITAEATSTTTSIVFDELAPGGMTEDYLGAWLIVTATGSGDPALHEIVRVTNVNFTGSNSSLTIAPALSAAPDSGDCELEVHPRYKPDIFLDLINEILEDLELPIYLPLSLVVDGDMETSGTSNWTLVGGFSSMSKVTNPRHGTQALSVTGTTAGERYALSTSFNLAPGTPVLVSSDLKCSAAAVNGRVELWDDTNSERIEYGESDMTAWGTVYYEATVPATCESLSVRLVADIAVSGQSVQFDHVIVLPKVPGSIGLPTAVEYFHDVEEAYYFQRGGGVTAGDGARNLYRVRDGLPHVWEADIDFEVSGSTTVPTLLMLGDYPVDQPLWVKAKKDYAPLAAGSITPTTAPKNLIVGLTYAALLEHQAQEILREDPLARIEWTNLMTAAAERRKELAGIYRQWLPDEAVIKGAGRR